MTTVENKAILIGVITPESSEGECIISLDELERLADTAGISSPARIYQNRTSPDTATYIGKGKLDEAKNIIEANDINIAIFDDELSPSQIKNIEKVLDIEVIDRTMLILEIFEQHAHTSEGKLQVEIAQLRYTMPRLTGKGKAMSRLGGGGGGAGAGARRGSGETKLEIDRRNIKSRIATLEDEIKQLEISRGVMRSRREKTGIPNIAIAGYTNSGKSTLLNYLTDAGILAENKLFATLDPTTRKLKLPAGTEVLLTDTVGLIRKLPHHLVRAFKSTLDEINYADIILLVSDISDPEHQNQLEVAKSLLTELGISEKPIITVYNKIDAQSPIPPFISNKFEKGADVGNAAPGVPQNNQPTSNDEPTPDEVYISAKTGEGIEDLLNKIQEVLESQRKSVVFVFPVNGKEQGYISYLYKNAAVSDVEYGGDFTTVRAVVDNKIRNMYEMYLG